MLLGGNILYIRGAQIEQNGYFTCRATGSDGKYVEDKALVVVVPVVPAEKQLAAEITPKAANHTNHQSSKFFLLSFYFKFQRSLNQFILFKIKKLNIKTKFSVLYYF